MHILFVHVHGFNGTAFRPGGHLPQSVTSVSKENVCKDEWSAYCWDKSWGSCPVTCSYEETYCYSYVYDSTGLRWTFDICAALACGMPLSTRDVCKSSRPHVVSCCKLL